MERIGLGLGVGLLHDVSEVLGWWEVRIRRCGGM